MPIINIINVKYILFTAGCYLSRVTETHDVADHFKKLQLRSNIY